MSREPNAVYAQVCSPISGVYCAVLAHSPEGIARAIWPDDGFVWVRSLEDDSVVGWAYIDSQGDRRWAYLS